MLVTIFNVQMDGPAFESGHQNELIPTSVIEIDEALIGLVNSVNIGDKTKTCHQQQFS